VLLVGRYGWPHLTHDSAGFLCQLAEGLAREQMHVEVVTPKHHANWPDQVEWKGIRMHRPIALPRREWSMGRYGRALQHWLQNHGGGHDVMIALSMREEAVAVVEAAKHLRIASIVRDDGFEADNDFFWARQSKTAWKTWTQAGLADRIVTPLASHHRRLIANGCSPAKLVRIAGGVNSSNTEVVSRQAARESLANINLDLSAGHDDPVLLSIGSMRLNSSIHLMSRQIPWLVGRFPRAKIWLIGDGPARETIHGELKAEGVRDCVAMPGSFANLTDLFAAADVFVQMGAADSENLRGQAGPSNLLSFTGSPGLDFLLPTALASSVPLVVAQTPETMESLASQPSHGTGRSDTAIREDSVDVRNRSSDLADTVGWFEPDATGKSFRDVVRKFLEDLPTARRNAEEASKTCFRILPYQRVLREYVKLIHELTHGSDRSPDVSDPESKQPLSSSPADPDQSLPKQAPPGFDHDRG